MKSKILSRVVVIALSMFMILGLLAGCGSSTDTESKGSILWMSNISSGIGYDADKAYLEAICEEAGYELIIVYGDMFNDPQGNLSQVMAGMTTDVKGIILSQDGGISNIMAEYPDLYVVGYNTDIRSIFEADGADASLLENDKFLGDIVDGFADGALLGEARAEFVIEQGYTKVSTVSFPGFAYPNLPEADVAFRAAIAEYNETADTPIEILGEEAATLMFEPLQESYFLEDGYSDLDAIVGFCAGLEFIYPTMKTAMANGTCSADTKLITGGLDNDETMMAGRWRKRYYCANINITSREYRILSNHINKRN